MIHQIVTFFFLQTGVLLLNELNGIKVNCTLSNASDNVESCIEERLINALETARTFEKICKEMKQSNIFQSSIVLSKGTQCFQTTINQFYKSIITNRNIADQCIDNNRM